jgi:alkanesulfonate monooxygenase SsuD/methylene tetrahydromethanopterin reductase-like flavin-dependent oxidoreductase (luciferase family)
MKLLWTEENVTFHGAFYHVTDLTLWPRPVGPLPRAIWVGGHSDAAHRRVGRLCDGWLPSYVTPDEVGEGITAIKRYAMDAERDVPDDHFGVLIPVSYDPEPTQALRVRRAGIDPHDIGAFGSSEAMIAQARRYIDVGATKLVLVPATAADLGQLQRLRQEVAIPLES